MISSTASSISYISTAAQTVFSFPFRILAQSDLKVFRVVDGVRTDITSSIVSVSGVDNEAGGAVTLPAQTDGRTILLVRDTAFTQGTDFSSLNFFHPSQVERQADRSTVLVQEVKRDTQSAIRMPLGEVINTLPAASSRANKMLTFDAQGAPALVVQGGVVIGAEGSGLSALTLSELRAIDTTNLSNGQVCTLLGHTQAGDGGGGTFWLKTEATDADDDGMAIQPVLGDGRWLRVYSGDVDVKWFGADASGATDSREAIQAAIDYAALHGAGTLISAGVYLLTLTNWGGGSGGATALVLPARTHLKGEGRSSSVLKLTDSAFGPGAFVRVIMTDDETYVDDITVSDLTIDGNRANQLAGNNGGNIVTGPGRRTRIFNIHSKGATGQGIQVANSEANPGEDQSITDCYVSDCSYIGIQAAQFRHIQISGNQVRGCVDNGIDVYGNKGAETTAQGRQFIVTNNHITSCSSGVFLETVRSGICAHNTVDTCTTGIYCNRINGEPKDLSITDNLVTGCATGFGATGNNNNITINRNLFSGFTVAGCMFGGLVGGGGADSTYITASDNILVPATATTPLFITGGNLAAFILVKGTVVNYDGFNSAYRFVQNATTHVQVRAREFFSITGTPSPDLIRELATITSLTCTTLVATSLTCASAVIDNLSGAVTVTGSPLFTTSGSYSLAAGTFTIPVVDGCGTVYICAVQGGVGRQNLAILYSRNGTSISVHTLGDTYIGSPVVTAFAGTGAGHIECTIPFSNTNLSWAFHRYLIQ